MTYTPEQLREDGHFGTREEMIARYKELKAAHADALEELARLRSRLEIDFVTDGNGKRVPFPEGGPDGVACRDETIRLLEAALAESERKCERLRAQMKQMEKESREDLRSAAAEASWAERFPDEPYGTY